MRFDEATWRLAATYTTRTSWRSARRSAPAALLAGERVLTSARARLPAAEMPSWSAGWHGARRRRQREHAGIARTTGGRTERRPGRVQRRRANTCPSRTGLRRSHRDPGVRVSPRWRGADEAHGMRPAAATWCDTDWDSIVWRSARPAERRVSPLGPATVAARTCRARLTGLLTEPGSRPHTLGTAAAQRGLPGRHLQRRADRFISASYRAATAEPPADVTAWADGPGHAGRGLLLQPHPLPVRRHAQDAYPVRAVP